VIHALNESTEESVWKVGQLADRFPDITMLVLDGYSSFEGTKQCSMLAARHPNLVFDTAIAFHSDHVIDDIKRFGAHRYVFGTDLYSPPFGHRISHILVEILESDLDDEQKRAVVGGTARRLFEIGR
jgi:predicted TIM-barrel fold metal-dependent hydrolase